MILLLINLLLALIWTIVSGSFTLLNLFFGFILGAFTLYLVREQIGTMSYVVRAKRIAWLTLFFFRELLLSAWRVAVVVCTPRLDIKPGIFAYRLRIDRDFEITLLANMITLTPGTLSVDVSEDRSTLYVHALDCSDLEGNRRDIANGFERMILEAFR